MSFLPALLGIPSTEIDGESRQLLTHDVKQGGMAIRNPVDTVPSVHSASLVANCHLAVSLVDSGTQFDLGAHCHCATEAGQVARKSQLSDERLFLDPRGQDNPSVARQDNRNCAAGAWLSVFPNRLNGTSLLADKWRDNIRLRYNHSRWICLLPAMAAGLRCQLSMHCCAKLAALSISDMMMWQMSGGICVALRSPPV
jgi:hypothetical protein